MPTYTSITITKRAENFFTLHDNTLPSDEDRWGSEYSGIATGNYITIKHRWGGIIYNNQPYNIFTYVDQTDGGIPVTPTSALALELLLIEAGFFQEGSGSGGGGADYLAELSDVNIPTKFGNGGKFLMLNNAETEYILSEASGTFRIKDALDWNGGNPLPGKYVITETATNPDGSVNFNQADIDQIINTPIPQGTLRVTAKGQNPDTGTPNLEPFVKEIGDFCEGVVGGFLQQGIYLGGSDTDISNYLITNKTRIVN